jgi:hypothetical protein
MVSVTGTDSPFPSSEEFFLFLNTDHKKLYFGGAVGG